MKKLVWSSLVSIGLSTVILSSGVSAESEQKSESLDIVDTSNVSGLEPTEGADLIETINEDNGVTVEVYNQNTPERKALIKEQNLKNKKETSNDFQALGGNGSWEVVDTEPWVFNGNWYDIRHDQTHYSTGGDYGIDIPAHIPTNVDSSVTRDDGPILKFNLYSENTFASDELIFSYTNRYIGDDDYYIKVSGIDAYVDGSNNKADLYTEHRANYELKYQGTSLPVTYLD